MYVATVTGGETAKVLNLQVNSVWLDLDRWVSGEPIGRWTLMMSLGQYRPLLALP